MKKASWPAAGAYSGSLASLPLVGLMCLGTAANWLIKERERFLKNKTKRSLGGGGKHSIRFILRAFASTLYSFLSFFLSGLCMHVEVNRGFSCTTEPPSSCFIFDWELYLRSVPKGQTVYLTNAAWERTVMQRPQACKYTHTHRERERERGETRAERCS